MATPLKQILCLRYNVLNLGRNYIVPQISRPFGKWVAPYLRELYRRKVQLGPQKPIPRSHFVEWNYKAELFAFGARLNEPFKENTLRVAFTHQSYIADEEKKREEVGVPTDIVGMKLQDNEKLTETGEKMLDNYIKPFLRVCYPYLPEEGIESIEKFLRSENELAFISSNLGVKDLILCKEYPPSPETTAKTLKALIGALLKDSDQKRVGLFIQDFIITHLIGHDVNQIWLIVDPMGVLANILKREGKEPPEPRLIREAGRNTILAVYQIGIYSNKKLIGTAPGETVEVAEEEAARDCLRRMFRTTDKEPPLPFGAKGRTVALRHQPNLSLNEWTYEKATAHVKCGDKILSKTSVKASV